MLKHWCIVLLICICFEPKLVQAKLQLQPKPKEVGLVKEGKKVGIWHYYHAEGWEEKREKWAHGQLRWTIFYNQKHKKTKSIDKKGKETIYKNCNCSN